MSKFKAPSKFNKGVITIDPVANLSKYVGPNINECQIVSNGSLKDEVCAFYPIQQNTNDNSTKENTFQKQSRLSRFLYKFKHKSSIREPKKSTKERSKTIAIGADGNNLQNQTTSWIRRFSKNNNNTTPPVIPIVPIDNPSNEVDIPAKLNDIFSPPPQEKPMDTIESVQNSAHSQQNKLESLPTDNKTTRTSKSRSFSINTFYNNSFFKTGGRLPISYDNSQITDETIT
ncbi:hypothetical protein KGF54_001773 [Candida jiufengensis]|uniref:uncharacterized protein n=1 Tax=Candida jiufengensis TaxID=497108 RepID=UPI0022246480|nr:uncharacterized protein KGF54_001773 [Candida jiufengensis]KAI5955212.1 hypothetical protein KGF54_001773 [Candida jiufengensis]